MYWIDKNNNAHYVRSCDDISKYDYENNASSFIEDDSITATYGNGYKKFIVQGAGYRSPYVQNLVSANTISECKCIVENTYKERIDSKQLIIIGFYEVVD